MTTFRIAGREWTVDAAVDHLADYVADRPTTLVHVDGYALSGRAPKDDIVAEDIAMLVVFAARPSADTAASLLAWGHVAEWPDPELQPQPFDADLEASNGEWAEREDVSALASLHESLRRGPAFSDGSAHPTGLGGRNRFSTASKLVYCRWPHAVPVVDSQLEAAYADRAGELRVAFPDAPWVVRQWMAIREDLAVDETALSVRGAQLQAAERLVAKKPNDHRPRLPDAVEAFQGIGPQRVADMLTWSTTGS